jgi:elongator complex protein 2
VGEHDASVTAIAVLKGSSRVVSTGSDSVIKIWDIETAKGISDPGTLFQTIKLKIIPLAVDIHPLDASSSILAVGGSHSSIQIFSSGSDSKFTLAATLTGHSGWIRSLSFIHETEDRPNSDVLLASASQDKFIRLWRVHRGQDLPSAKMIEDPSLGLIGKTVSTKAHRFIAGEMPHSITFEALLFGHEDWIYTCTWNRSAQGLRLLSSSADNSISVWEADPSTGIWLSSARLGDISAEKGATTATGSIGGFWTGLWSPSGDSVTSLGRTGSWRLWTLNSTSQQWEPRVGCGGHVRSVTDLTWSRAGTYILSTSLDQTTRLHASWIRNSSSSWHEFARPQIHGYDLNCIDTISDETFISGADEKPLRVFREPAIVADVLHRLAGGPETKGDELPDAANIPVLGLSNQAIDPSGGESEGVENAEPKVSVLDYNHPPLEDHLSKHLLWPETQKVYGHGYEISSVAVSQDGNLVATACKASSTDHAVIRVYETNEWREQCKPLSGHSLTITDMSWSPDGKYLLSVSRDRTWSVFEASEDQKSFNGTTAKGHSRMILSCAWAPLQTGRVFATAGRDKAVKLWKQSSGKFELAQTVMFETPVTAISVLPVLWEGKMVVASGLESGHVYFTLVSSSFEVESTLKMGAPCPTGAITKLTWKQVDASDKQNAKLAIASEDLTLRIVNVQYR